MSLELKRWLWYVAFLLIVFVLCWQNSYDSIRVTNTTLDAIQKISHVLGKDLEYSTKLYYTIRKIGHGLVFAGLAFTGHLAISGSANNLKAAIISSLVMSLLIASVAEISQAYTFDRQASFTDAIINISGSLVGILVGMLFEFIRVELAKRKAETV